MRPAWQPASRYAASARRHPDRPAPWRRRPPCPGSNQLFTQMILTLMLGLTVWAPRIVELMPEITSGNRERADVAEHARLGHFRGDDALDVAALVEAARIGADIGGALEAGRSARSRPWESGLATLDGRDHVAEDGGEDQLVAGPRQLFDRALEVRTLVDVFQVSGVDLVAQRLDQTLAADLVLTSSRSRRPVRDR